MSAILPALPRSAFTSARRSIDMGWQNLAQRKPPGASCNWVKEELALGAPYRWWRGSSGQGCNVASLDIFSNGWQLAIAPPSAAWWLGEVGGYNVSGGGSSSCGFTNGYVTYLSTTSVRVDVWGALRDGVWSSSISFQVRCSGGNGATYVLNAGSVSSSWHQEQTFTTLTASSCSSGGVLKTVTVYDDGRITIT
jgi:hypothetical protein